jgi:tetratricopeptide (TPR) repeat protein
MFLCGQLRHAHAVKWQAMDGTTRYMVAYDEHSIRQTPQGRIEIVLRFTPKGTPQRKSAAVVYKDKRYRLHQETYEIDCLEQAAFLGSIDILDSSKKRLKQLHGGVQPFVILSGSVLDDIAKRICPVPNEYSEEENEPEEPIQTEEPDKTNDSALSRDMLKQIENLKTRTASSAATADEWKELGNIYFDTDQPEQAIKAYERALALHPDDADTLNDLGAMYRQTGDFERALSNFEKAYAKDPGNLESLYNSGYVYAFDLNNTSKALVIWRRYLELDQKSEAARQVQSFIDRYGK